MSQSRADELREKVVEAMQTYINCFEITAGGQPIPAEDISLLFPALFPAIVPVKKIIANDYNPNKVASPEMKSLLESIRSFGLAYGCVVVYDAVIDTYIMVDGFHRYLQLSKKLKYSHIPCIILDIPISDAMKATVLFNRARGKHQVELMSQLVTKLIKLGWNDIEVANHLGMEAEEVLRLKQMTGLAGLFEGEPYSRAWERYEPSDNS